MQITDMLNQYNRNLSGGAELSGRVQGTRQVVSSLSELSVGNVFEGSVNSIENGVVTLGLSDGKTIQARLDSGVSIRQGESMFFQVKSNNGSQIAIRPFSGSGANPALLGALEAANLQASGRMLTMVNAMMEQSMPIDKQSLMGMARLVAGNEGTDPSSIVQMVKLGIPVTGEMAAQFENYKSDQYAILNQLESVMEQLPDKLAGGSLTADQMLELNRQIADILLGNGDADGDAAQGAGGNLAQAGTLGEAAMGVVGEAGQPGTAAQAEGLGGAAQAGAFGGAAQAEGLGGAAQADATAGAASPEAAGIFGEALQQGAAGRADGTAGAAFAEADGETAGALSESASKTGSAAETGQTNAAAPRNPDALANLFDEGELQQLSRQLEKVPQMRENPSVFADGKLNENLTSRELLKLLGQSFSEKDVFDKQGLSELAASKNYRTLVRNVMEQEWLLRPEDLKTENKVNELYQRLDRQMEQLEKALKGFGQDVRQFSGTASDVRSNIQFMNQINQTYAYVQIPLKLAGQNAHSDLYVYTGRRRAKGEDEDLTAFLHLDMEHLGSTDVSIRMHKKSITTNFYLSDEASCQIILDHLDILEERLEKLGYSVNIQVSGEEEKPNPVEHFLKGGQSSAGGRMVRRYSFDVRA